MLMRYQLLAIVVMPVTTRCKADIAATGTRTRHTSHESSYQVSLQQIDPQSGAGNGSPGQTDLTDHYRTLFATPYAGRAPCNKLQKLAALSFSHKSRPSGVAALCRQAGAPHCALATYHDVIGRFAFELFLSQRLHKQLTHFCRPKQLPQYYCTIRYDAERRCSR